MATVSKIRVLYLEDDEDSREMVTFMLNLSGIEVSSVTSSKDAARLAKSEIFDLYLLDGLLPTGDSLQLCRDLRADNPSTPIIFYSALGFQSDIQKGMEAGANDYLVKPYNGDLSEAVLRAVQNASKDSTAYPQPAEKRRDLPGDAVQECQVFTSA